MYLIKRLSLILIDFLLILMIKFNNQVQTIISPSKLRELSFSNLTTLLILTDMPLFIAFSLALCFMVQVFSSMQSILVTPLVIYIGLAVAITSILVSLFKKLTSIIWYDIFSSSTLLVWFAYWKPLFKNDSPIFFFYPVYFALMTAFVSLFFISQRHKIDDESFRFMQFISQKSIIQPWVLMLGVLGSLELQQHFMLYPTLMTLLIMKFVLDSCLEGRSHR